jgi:hypothetical protein
MSIERTIRKVLKETTKEVMWLRRRINTPDISQDLHTTVVGTLQEIDPCEYKTNTRWMDLVIEKSIHRFIDHWGELCDAENMVALDDLVYEIIDNKYGKILEAIYDDRVCD